MVQTKRIVLDANILIRTPFREYSGNPIQFIFVLPCPLEFLREAQNCSSDSTFKVTDEAPLLFLICLYVQAEFHILGECCGACDM